MKLSKAREFWVEINEISPTIHVASTRPVESNQIVHVIEISAYEEKCRELAALAVGYETKDEHCIELEAKVAKVLNEVGTFHLDKNLELESKLAVAVKLLKEGKRKFTPNTTNSDVDCFIADNEIKGDSDG